MSCEWIAKNHLEKNPSKNQSEIAACEQKITKNQSKTVKVRVKLPHVNKKSLERKRISVQIPFSHSPLSLERKTLRRKTTRFFAPFPVSG